MAFEEDRVVRLEARIRDLEDELDNRNYERRRGSHREGGGYGRGGRRRRGYGVDFEEVRDEFTDVTDRKMDELSRLVTGAFRASLEGLRGAAEGAGEFVEDTLERSIPEPGDDPVDGLRRLPGDVSHGVARGIERSLDVPGRAAERFRRAWTEEEGGRRRRRLGARVSGRRESTRGRRRVGTGEDYDRWSRDELYDRAAELGIDNFRELSRDELIDELRREQPRYEDWSESDLYVRAGDIGIEHRADLSRDELVAELRRRESRGRPARAPLEERDIRAGGEYDRLSRPERQQRAEDVGVQEPGSKSDNELTDAIASDRPPLEEMSKPQLTRLAQELDVEGRSNMNTEQLIEAIREREGDADR